MPIFELGRYIPVQSHVWKFGSDWSSFKSYRVQKHFSGGGSPIRGGLHLTCDAHFRTQMSYFSQNSCVKIWFGLVEIRVMLMLRGAEEWKTPSPIRGGYMWLAMPIFELGRAFLDKSHVWKFGSDWLRLSRVIVLTNKKKKKKKKKKKHAAQNNIFTEFSFRAYNNNNKKKKKMMINNSMKMGMLSL